MELHTIGIDLGKTVFHQTAGLIKAADHKNQRMGQPAHLRSWSFEPCDWTRPERHSIVHVV
jgi:hypothetical protein